MLVFTDDELVLPVTASEFADYAKLDDTDPSILGALYAATSMAIAFLKLDLISREWTLIYEDWPTVGAASYPSISRQNYKYKTRIELPYANLISVSDVEVSGETYTDYRVISNRPTQLQFDSFSVYDTENPGLKVVYTAGYGATADDVPEVIKQAIIMLASYVYAHNGSCDSSEALNMSGAKALLTPYAVRGGIAI